MKVNENLKNAGKAFIDVFRYTGRSIDDLVKLAPWAVIILVIIIATIYNIVALGNARSERDYYNHQLIITEQKLDSINNLRP